MNEIIMRRITSEDVPALSFIAKETFFDTFTGTCTPDDMDDFLEKYYNETTLHKEIKEDGLQYFIAEVNGKAVGYLSYREEASDFPEIQHSKALELKRFYVSKEYHGKGTAHTMMNFFLDYAAKNKFEAVFLGVWEYNFRAQKFYGKYGFAVTPHKHDFPIGNTPQTDIYLIKFM